MENETTQDNQMPTPAMQGEKAAKDNHGPAAFISIEKDLASKSGTDQNSWFIVNYLNSSRGKLPLLMQFLNFTTPDGKSMVQAMYSVLDPKTNKYLTEEQDYPLDKCTLSAEKLEVLTPSGNYTGDASQMHLTGNFKGFSFDLNITNPGGALYNLGAGLMPMLGDVNYHYALPYLQTKGTVTMNGEKLDVTGETWLDRQWGKTPRFFSKGVKKWIWFAIMLDNGDRISVWDVNEIAEGIQHAWATIVHKTGGHEVVALKPLEATSSEPWKSPKTGHIYPTKWDMQFPTLDASIQFEAKVKDQEIFSPAGAHKYEGTTEVTGQIRGEEVKGTVIIELVGDWT